MEKFKGVISENDEREHLCVVFLIVFLMPKFDFFYDGKTESVLEKFPFQSRGMSILRGTSVFFRFHAIPLHGQKSTFVNRMGHKKRKSVD